MLKSLQLTNFRKVISDEMIFTPGINVIRGANEASKSSRLEAVVYALFGSKALRTPLDACVTWGEPVSSLKVVLTLDIGGDSYTFTRAKSGSEVTKNGATFCTGQNETSTLAATLLGVDVNTAGKLLLANQNSIRGALDGGSKELSVLIEDLSSMGVFDRILEAAQAKLVTGSPALLEERLKGAQATLEAATQNLPALPNAEDHDAAVKALKDKVAAIDLDALEAAMGTATKTWQDESARYMRRVNLESDVEKASNEMQRATAQVAELKPASEHLVIDNRADLTEQLNMATQHVQRVSAYKVFQSLPNGDPFKGSAAEFATAYDAADNELRAVERQIDQTVTAVTLAKGRRINHSTCDKCGQDVTHLKSVIETNAAVDAEVAGLTEKEVAVRADLVTKSEACSALKKHRDFAGAFNPTLQKILAFVTLDESTYPAGATWNGPIPCEAPNVDEIKRRLAENEARIKARDTAISRYELAVEQQGKAAASLQRLQTSLETIDAPSSQTILDLTDAKDAAIIALNAAKGELILLQREIDGLVSTYNSAKQLWDMAQARVTDASKVIADCQKDLASLGFNNALVKKLRAIRPVIASKIWNTVLTSVSIMFSQMRCEPSVVTKEANGFKVNGQSVEGLSGSTLDILGVALRCALLRTFVPHCGLLVLDEPAQGCDQSRTEALMGFLQTMGMAQTLLITHEIVSSAIADNIIEL